MSVGYDLAGIKSEKVDAFIEGLKDASATPAWEECRSWALANFDRFEHVDADFVASITPQVSTSMTVSTMHGCPAGEIESIVSYLLTEKGLDNLRQGSTPPSWATTSCASVSTGWATRRSRWSVRASRTISPGRMPEAMFERLIQVAKDHGRQFGIKVCNTLPVNVLYNELPADQMYMSGVALFPLAIAVVRRIAERFDGNIHVSFSAGADENNIAELYHAGIWPVTLATALLRPQGYDRFAKMAENVGTVENVSRRHVDVAAVVALDEASVAGDAYRRPERAQGKRSLPAALPLLDCLACRACVTVCPNRANVLIDRARVQAQADPAYRRHVQRVRQLRRVLPLRGAPPTRASSPSSGATRTWMRARTRASCAAATARSACVWPSSPVSSTSMTRPAGCPTTCAA